MIFPTALPQLPMFLYCPNGLPVFGKEKAVSRIRILDLTLLTSDPDHKLYVPLWTVPGWTARWSRC